MFSPSTIAFIRSHLDADVRTLALKRIPDPDVDLRAALEQISGRQAALRKLPTWAATDGIVYPPHLSMEQCSSEFTALYKARLASRLVQNSGSDDETTLIDLTGGFGVDFSFMARGFKKAVYVERNEHLCHVAAHNFGVLGLNHATVENTSAEDYLADCAPASLIFIDPARRDSAGNRTFAVADCTPDVLALKDLLLAKAPTVIIKLSPMLDWRKCVSDFRGSVSEVHIVSVDNECKELLLVLTRTPADRVRVFCVNNDDVQEFSTDETADFANTADVQELLEPFLINSKNTDETADFGALTTKTLYISEPNSSVMKGGFFSQVEQRFGVRRIGVNSNLFLSQDLPEHFPGRVFAVEAVSTMNRRELKTLLSGITKANITVRNFPLSVAELRKRLHLKDGGDCYIFATTDSAGRHLLIKGVKKSSF